MSAYLAADISGEKYQVSSCKEWRWRLARNSIAKEEEGRRVDEALVG
jgi:hypothetical protein